MSKSMVESANRPINVAAIRRTTSEERCWPLRVASSNIFSPAFMCVMADAKSSLHCAMLENNRQTIKPTSQELLGSVAKALTARFRRERIMAL